MGCGHGLDDRWPVFPIPAVHGPVLRLFLLRSRCPALGVTLLCHLEGSMPCGHPSRVPSQPIVMVAAPLG